MLSRIWSSTAPASKRILQPFRSLSVSCVRFQTNSSQDQNAPKSFYQKLKEYPELHRLHLESRGTTHGYKEVWAKLRAEPELLRARQEESRRLNRRLVETSATARAKKVATAKAYFQAHKHDETYLRYKSINRWSFGMSDRSKSAWARQNLPWKTHCPIEHPEKDYRFYSCCGTERRLKSGWQSKQDPSEFLCNTHYAARGWDTAMPEGYEDVRSFSDIRARYKKLNP